MIKTYSEFLNESSIDPNVVNPYLYKTEKEVHDFMVLAGFRRYTGYTVNSELEVQTNSSIGLNYDEYGMSIKMKHLPVKFEHTGDFFIANHPLRTLEGCPYSMSSESYSSMFYCNDNDLRTLLHAPKKPTDYSGNPCSKIYDELGWTDEAHAQSIIFWMNKYPNEKKECLEFVERYKRMWGPEWNFIIKKSRELRIVLGLEGEEELLKAYKISVDVEGDFY